jgi:decaprenyl-phosphate phosphoribosyltransferase
MQVYLSLLRVQSWIKNLLLVAPLVFSFNLFDTSRYQNVVSAFFSFCFLSSFVYVFNDLKDVESDKLHPRKQSRPLPSGKIGKTAAVITGLLSLVIAIALAVAVNSSSFFIALACYLCINIAYITVLKQISLVDCFCIATGFVIRVLAGCYAISVAPSDWIVVVTFFLALFLAFSKRKSEIVMLDKNAAQHRSSLSGYSVKTLDVFIYICASICVTAYLMYTLTSTSIPAYFHDRLKYSAFFVVFGLFRYIQLNEADRNTDGDPTVLFYKDRLLQITILLWVVYSVYVIYG